MGRKSERKEEGPERPVEVDRVRFEGRKLASGLFRHQPVKFVFELGKRRKRKR